MGNRRSTIANEEIPNVDNPQADPGQMIRLMARSVEVLPNRAALPAAQRRQRRRRDPKPNRRR